jgi:hypothetical protein
MKTLTVAEVEQLAREAHAGQVDKIGVPYFEHVRAVADGLAPFGAELEMAGLLHDVVEDTGWTFQGLLDAGVPAAVLGVVDLVTNRKGENYQSKIHRITTNRGALLTKIADNAHNSREDRAAQLPEATRERLRGKYAKARQVLWGNAFPEEVQTVVGIVNPGLLTPGNLAEAARSRVHVAACRDSQCVHDGSEPGPQCLRLEGLLEQVVETSRACLDREGAV